MFQERQNGWRVQIGEFQRAWCFAGFLLHKSEKQAEGISIRGDSSWTDLLVLTEVLCEEALHKGGESCRSSHLSPPADAGGIKSTAAAESISGVAVMYQ
jgi:hypothetical protein